ncbi:Thg1 C terminal domain-containing protein [Lentinula detonsa]|uniref:tRNA(His) guanylyltransferase n=1 Tax=Lentinula detonsa TaxID=2804962 RepID=A0AA38UTU6_9AGAR|nr:Thg1 C terminal domain-containing protein [Lentinula detonsa]
MAGSKFAYVKKFELPDTLLPSTFMVLRLDGHSFHRFSDQHGFVKPNDLRALKLMDHAAKSLMEEYKDIGLAFGESDEYSFLLRKSTALYNRRQAKIVSTLTSLFTSCYVFHWPKYFPDVPLQYPPSFDGRIVLYPSQREVRDYFAWRQADTHINNLYNTAFWALVQQGGQTTTEAHAILRGTVSKDKHEILFSGFEINYDKIDPRYRKGSVFVRNTFVSLILTNVNIIQTTPEEPADELSTNTDTTSVRPVVSEESHRKEEKKKKKVADQIELLHCDIIRDEFWDKYAHLMRD